MTPEPSLRDLVRELPVLTGSPPPFDPEHAPPTPTELFDDWFRAAVDAGVREPHAMTLSTVGSDGRPRARVLIVKDVDEGGWHFAISGVSQKGSELSGNPAAALTFYWREQMRQVRITGTARTDPREVAEADFLARGNGSRAMAITGRQSQPFTNGREIDDALARSQQELERNPQFVPDEWLSYCVQPEQVEFWQGDPQRRHTRIRYRRNGNDWSRERLWP